MLHIADTDPTRVSTDTLAEQRPHAERAAGGLVQPRGKRIRQERKRRQAAIGGGDRRGGNRESFLPGAVSVVRSASGKIRQPIAAADCRLAERLVGEAETRGEVVPVRVVPTARIPIHSHELQPSAQVGKPSLSPRRIDGVEVEKAQPVEALRSRPLIVIPQADVQRQALVHLDVVLEVAGRVEGLITDRSPQ